MKSVIAKIDGRTKVPIKLWLDENTIEESALEQAKNLANLPFIFKHIALMPDCHSGYGMPIGGVIATKGVVIPNAVGVDIGCGMCAIGTPWTTDDISKEQLLLILNKIKKQIPVGFNHHILPAPLKKMPTLQSKNITPIAYKYFNSARNQLGTLGGGNHFIEIQKNIEDRIWIMIHSGSRNIGFQIANYYKKLAVSLNKQWHAQIPKDYDLAFLPVDTEAAQQYLEEQKFALDFAYKNRLAMMNVIKEIFDSTIKWRAIDMNYIVNIHHNYVNLENHFGENVWVHRKGATLAREGNIGIIPGSQGTKSYIIRGLGNPQSFYSCSHGAGRILSRTVAKKELDLQTEIEKLNSQNINFTK